MPVLVHLAVSACGMATLDAISTSTNAFMRVELMSSTFSLSCPHGVKKKLQTFLAAVHVLLRVLAGGGDTGEELDISLLRITLFHEYWQGLLHQLDLATLQANSAVSLTPFGSKPNHTGSAAKPTDQPTSLQPSSPAASVAPSDAVSSAQNLNQPAASSSSLAEQGGATSSSSQAAAGAQLVDRLQEPEKQTSTSRQVSECFHCNDCMHLHAAGHLQLYHCFVTPTGCSSAVASAGCCPVRASAMQQ